MKGVPRRRQGLEHQNCRRCQSQPMTQVRQQLVKGDERTHHQEPQLPKEAPHPRTRKVAKQTKTGKERPQWERETKEREAHPPWCEQHDYEHQQGQLATHRETLGNATKRRAQAKVLNNQLGLGLATATRCSRSEKRPYEYRRCFFPLSL